LILTNSYIRCILFALTKKSNPQGSGVAPMTHSRSFRLAYLFLATAGIAAALAGGCGGSSSVSSGSTGGSGGSGGGGGSGPQPDFTLSIQPSQVTVLEGSANTVAVSVTAVNGFSSQVSVTISGMPSGVTAAPSQFSISPGSPQTVVLSASAGSTTGTDNLAVSAVSGALQHGGQISFAVSVYSTHPPFRTGYVRTDAQFDYGFLNFFPQTWMIYDPPTKRFFVSNTVLNRVDVFDATTEAWIARIPVPGAWVGDETPDHSTIYMGTQVGDLYEIDPVAMAVKARIPAVQIGPAGFSAYEARVMAGGKLALLGGQGGIPAVDGYSEVGLWDPTDNTLVTYASYYGSNETRVTTAPVCGFLENIGEMAISADRTRILLGSADSDDTLCSLDPNTGAYVTVAAYLTGIGVSQILVPADGKEIIVPSGSTVAVYDSTGLFQTDLFQIPGAGTSHFLLSLDGNTLYAAPYLSGQPLLAYNWRTHEQTGWAPVFYVGDIESTVTPMAVDETGLIIGPLGEGVGFLDAGALQAGPANPTIFLSGGQLLQPTFGPVQGGTSTLFDGLQTSKAAKVYFGNQLATGVSEQPLGIVANSPAGEAGAADVAVTYTDGGLSLFPEAFSYGPSIVEIAPAASTSEGGGKGIIYGYGFGPPTQAGTVDTSLNITVGGTPATVTAYSGFPYFNSIPFCCMAPIESLQFTWPAGTAGTSADISVTDSGGTTTAKAAARYFPSVQQFPLPGAALAQGIYDPGRNVYYFTDQSKIQIFSKTQGAWRTPIAIPGASRLWGVSLSPDGTKLAISDSGADLIYLLNPDTPNSIQTFSLPNTAFEQGSFPGGLAVTDSGIIYYNAFYIYFTGGWSLHRLDTSTGTVTHYQLQAGSFGADAYVRLLLSSDNARLYGNFGGLVYALDTATDTPFLNPGTIGGDYELALASNQTWMSAAEFLLDTDLNEESYVALTPRETWNQTYVYGEKMSPDGSFLFAPGTNSLDVLDGRLGTLLDRIALPVTLNGNFDALASDGKDNILVAITGQNGDGVAVIDLTSLAEPPPLPYVLAARSGLVRMAAAAVRMQPTVGSKSAGSVATHGAPRFSHVMNSPRR
jgi:hypothetical protein